MLTRVFNAKSVAVVGASSNPAKLGHIVLNNIISGGYRGRVYPVNTREESILGLRCYPNLTVIPDTLDLAIVAIPSAAVPSVLEDAGQKGIAGAVVISGGFREIGRSDLEASLVETARKTGVRILGPNCQGFSYLPNNLCASWPLLTKPGEMAIISQSGTVGATLCTWAEAENLGVSCCVALGNKCDVDEIDVIRFLVADGKTKVIAIYTEGLKEGKRFMEVAREVTPSIPMVILRAGRTIRGRQAAQSHTKSLAGRYEVFSGFAQYAGIRNVTTLQDLYDQTKGLGLVRRPRGKRMLIITSSGGCGVLASDTVDEAGLSMSSLPPEIAMRLKDELPPHCVVNNPFDLTGDANADMYEKVVRATSDCGAVDAYCLIFGDPLPNVADMVIRLENEITQPIVVAFLGGGEIEKKERQIFSKVRIPVFDTPERAVWALAACADQHELQSLRGTERGAIEA